MGNRGGLWYFVAMDFLAVLKRVADSVLGEGNHDYGTVPLKMARNDQGGKPVYGDELMVGRPEERQLKQELAGQQYQPPDPNVHYASPGMPQLKKASALEVVDTTTPAERIIGAARGVRQQNAEIDKEVLREKARQNLKSGAGAKKKPEPNDDGGIDI